VDVAEANARLKAAIENPLKPPKPQPLKYRNVRTLVDNIRFDSRLEAKRYQELKLLEVCGEIKKLRIHGQWYLHVQGERLGYYEADFDYWADGQRVIEDVKGLPTALYRWKKKHVLAEYGIEIREITA
jgi:Protein of unknown function (DUF1064)